MKPTKKTPTKKNAAKKAAKKAARKTPAPKAATQGENRTSPAPLRLRRKIRRYRLS